MAEYTILAVDDSRFNLQLINDILGKEYTILSAINSEMALKFTEKKHPDLILLDIAMPDKDGRELFKEIRLIEGAKDIPIIFLTADQNGNTEAECLELGASDFITKPIVPAVLTRRIEKTLELEEYHKRLKEKINEKTREVEAVVLQSISTIANTIDAKDEDTIGHSKRVAQYSKMMATRMGFDKNETARIYQTALLHDVGKIGIPDDILKKKGKLSDEEYATIKTHTTIGAEILSSITSIENITSGARYHHERYDGKGYPEGLKGEDIPIIGRIIAVADVYDALMSRRCYKESMSRKDVLNEIEKGKGTQFDPEIVSMFVQIVNEIGGQNP